jgi:hypothetical protein
MEIRYLIPLLLFEIQAFLSFALPLISNYQKKITVWDNVIPEPARNALHNIAKVSGLGHRVFQRPLVRNTNLIERALDAILTEMGDSTSEYVEYWSRQEWRNIEAHADVDENLAKYQDQLSGGQANEPFRYPNKGHVLYLKVGTEVRGPTCLFPNHTSGGELAKGKVELVTIPAVNGRLLQFAGNLLHAVPRPTDIWFLPFVQGAPIFLPEDKYGRSVILFNTWTEMPPKDMPLNRESCDAGDTLPALCNTKSVWKQQEFVETATDDHTKQSSAKVWLLGNERRRGFIMRTVNLVAPEDAKDILYDVSTPRKILLGEL